MRGHGAVEELVSDLYRQIDQMRLRGIKDKAGHRYNPARYKQGLEYAVASGDHAVIEYVRAVGLARNHADAEHRVGLSG